MKRGQAEHKIFWESIDSTEKFCPTAALGNVVQNFSEKV
jgi:hypothetical protein